MISFFFDTSIYSYQKTSSSVRKNSDFWTALNRLVTLDATVFRSSHSLMFYKKGVRKAFANIQKKKLLCWSIISNKVAGLQSGNLLKKKFRHRCFTSPTHLRYPPHSRYLADLFFLFHFFYCTIYNQNSHSETDSGLVKLGVMTNVFFHNQQHEIKIKQLICVKQISLGSSVAIEINVSILVYEKTWKPAFTEN